MLRLCRLVVQSWPRCSAAGRRFSSEALRSVEEAAVSERVGGLAESLCNLSLIETAQLVSVLQKRLNIQSLVQAPASFANAQASAASASASESSKPAAAEKTEFKAVLQKFDPASKAKIIREIKLILPQLNLVEAKTLVESAPKMIKEKLKKDEAEKLKKTLEDLGATVSLE